MRKFFRYTNDTVIMFQDVRPPDELAQPQRRDLYVEIDGARVRYRDEGDGPAVIFVHGWTLDLQMWESQAAELAPPYRVIRLDRRGFGSSSGNPSLIRDVADLRALCRHLQLQRVALVGMSQGARVALQLTSEEPAMISCLVLDGAPRIESMRGPSGPQELPYQHYRRLAQTRGLEAFRQEWAQHPLAKLYTENARTRELLAAMIARYPGRDLAEPLPQPPLVTNLQMIQSIAPPVLVIGGALDLDSRKRTAEELMLELRRAERIEIPGAGHLCNLDNPRAYNAALRNFLDRHAAVQTNH
jgi:pimeloyl-ACP methyl ester carboxylesterase